MSQAVKGPEVFRKSAPFLIRSMGRLKSLLLPPPRPGNTKALVILGVILQNLPGRLIQGYGLIFATFGAADMDKAPVEINLPIGV